MGIIDPFFPAYVVIKLHIYNNYVLFTIMDLSKSHAKPRCEQCMRVLLQGMDAFKQEYNK